MWKDHNKSCDPRVRFQFDQTRLSKYCDKKASLKKRVSKVHETSIAEHSVLIYFLRYKCSKNKEKIERILASHTTLWSLQNKISSLKSIEYKSIFQKVILWKVWLWNFQLYACYVNNSDRVIHCKSTCGCYRTLSPLRFYNITYTWNCWCLV